MRPAARELAGTRPGTMEPGETMLGTTGLGTTGLGTTGLGGEAGGVRVADRHGIRGAWRGAGHAVRAHEGLPAAGIAVVTVALANAARTRGQITVGQVTAGRFALASGLTAAVNRIDGGKMLALAGVVYLLLLSSLAAAAGPALVLLLIFITGCGIITGMQNGAASRRDG